MWPEFHGYPVTCFSSSNIWLSAVSPWWSVWFPGPQTHPAEICLTVLVFTHHVVTASILLNGHMALWTFLNTTSILSQWIKITPCVYTVYNSPVLHTIYKLNSITPFYVRGYDNEKTAGSAIVWLQKLAQSQCCTYNNTYSCKLPKGLLMQITTQDHSAFLPLFMDALLYGAENWIVNPRRMMWMFKASCCWVSLGFELSCMTGEVVCIRSFEISVNVACIRSFDMSGEMILH